MAVTAVSTLPPPAHAQPASQAIPGYNEAIIKKFTIATVVWALFGFSVGTFAALQLAFPELNLGEYLNFGRVRPVHTSAVVFAFGGNALIGTSLYVVQRTCQAGLWGGKGLAEFLFWGYQAFLGMALSGYLMGITQSREYAEPITY